jgi:O-antigen ligase
MRMNFAVSRNRVKLLLVVLGVFGAALGGRAVFLYGLDALVWLAAGIAFVVVLIYPHIGLYVMLLLVPLENLVILERGATLVRVVGIAAFAAWVPSRLVRKELLRSLFESPLTMPMLVFLALCAISVLWSDFGAWRRAMVTYVQLVAWVFMVFDLVDSPRRLKQALFFFFLGAMVSAGFMVHESISGPAPSTLYYRPEGGQGDPNYSASTLLMVLPVVLSFVERRRGWQRLLGLASGVFLLAAVGFTVSRTALLVVPVLVASYLAMQSRHHSRAKLMLIVVLVLLATLPLWPWQRVEYRFTQVDLGRRFRRAEQGLQMFVKYPVLGRGLGKLTAQYDVLHDLFLEMLTQLGVPGLLAMIWIWAIAWRSLSKAQEGATMLQDEELLSLIPAIRVSVIVCLLFSLSLSTQVTRTLWLMFALAENCYRIVAGVISDRVGGVSVLQSGGLLVHDNHSAGYRSID